MFALYIDLSQEKQLLQFYDKFVQYNSNFIKSFDGSLSSFGKLQNKDKLIILQAQHLCLRKITLLTIKFTFRCFIIHRCTNYDKLCI